MRKWERSARDSTFICNQTSVFSRCLTKIQDSMATDLKAIQKSTTKPGFFRHGVKVDTVAALRNSTLHMTSLFPDDVISKAEEEIDHHEDKQHSSGSHKKSDWYHPCSPSAKNTPDTSLKSSPPA